MKHLIILVVALCGDLVVATTPWIPHAPGQVDHWEHRHELLLNQTRQHSGDVKAVFLGDSITYRWSKLGLPVWTKYYAPRGAFNYGIGGDRTENILWRLKYGEFENVNPKLVVLMIGTNNVSHKDNATAIAKGVSTILEEIHLKMPKSKVLLLSVLPRGTVKYDYEITELNLKLHRLADQTRVFWFDLAVHFEITPTSVISELYEPDLIHLSTKGYELFHDKLEATFVRLMD